MNKLLITALFILPTMTFAGTQYGRVVEIKGSAFVSYNGQTHEIRKGETLYTESEINVESSGQVSFTDNADHRFHLGSSTSVAVSANKVELRDGDMWVQSINKVDNSRLVSANALVDYTGGEAIFSYDSSKGKTQLMVINGLMKLSNLRAPELNLTVAEGNFSFVDLGFEEGMPRDPTPVGTKTYGQLVSLFKGVAPMDAHSAEIFKGNEHTAPASRAVASVKEEKAEKKEVHEMAVEVKKEVAQMKKEAAPVVKKTVRTASTPGANKTIVKIYGLAGSDTSATTDIYDIPAVVTTKTAEVGKRAPASVTEVETSTVQDLAVPNSEVKPNSMTPQYKESEKLIEQLNKL